MKVVGKTKPSKPREERLILNSLEAVAIAEIGGERGFRQRRGQARFQIPTPDSSWSSRLSAPLSRLLSISGDE